MRIGRPTLRMPRSDLALARDDTARFLPWLMAFMVFLAALALAGLFVLADAARTFDRGIENTITIQIPAGDNAAADQESVKGAVAMLAKLPGVQRAEALDRDKVVRLLEPWLGPAARSNEIPLPWVIDVTLDRSSATTAETITNVLQPYIPGITVDDHAVWLQALVRAIHSSEWIALAIVAMITMAAAATVVFATRAGMGLHRDTIEVMHFVGAEDNYIARQFAARATVLGLKGALIGVVLAIPTLLLLTLMIGRLGFGLLPDVRITPGAWTAIALLVPASALLAMATARATVLKSLARLV